MTAETVARILEAVICASPFVGVPLMIWRDPANLRPRLPDPEEES